MVDPITTDGKEAGERKGCFFYGCVGSLITMLLAIIIVAGGGYYVYNRFGQIIDEQVLPLTDEQPKVLPASGATREDYQTAEEKLSVFSNLVDNNRPATLVLTAREINAMIENHPDLLKLRGLVVVNLSGNEIGGEVVFPLNSLPVERLRNRYLNGSAKFSVTTGAAGQVELRLRSFEVKGKTPPREIMDQLSSANLLEEARRNPKALKVLARLKSATVAKDQLVIETR